MYENLEIKNFYVKHNMKYYSNFYIFAIVFHNPINQSFLVFNYNFITFLLIFSIIDILVLIIIIYNLLLFFKKSNNNSDNNQNSNNNSDNSNGDNSPEENQKKKTF